MKCGLRPKPRCCVVVYRAVACRVVGWSDELLVLSYRPQFCPFWWIIFKAPRFFQLLQQSDPCPDENHWTAESDDRQHDANSPSSAHQHSGKGPIRHQGSAMRQIGGAPVKA